MEKKFYKVHYTRFTTMENMNVFLYKFNDIIDVISIQKYNNDFKLFYRELRDFIPITNNVNTIDDFPVHTRFEIHPVSDGRSVDVFIRKTNDVQSFYGYYSYNMNSWFLFDGNDYVKPSKMGIDIYDGTWEYCY